ncbi:phosphocholine-specific phospholipase C [Actinokineospora sp. HUAS TT18]|uniref:phosphocholine-specific phospholipase C n=1 Tax=Actinokineospora sp. HUAS TT18 TaxID=3447451 RepID=UPI003F528ABE
MADGINRRQLFGMAGAAAAVAASGALPQVLRDLLEVKVEAGGSIADIQHVVIFMQENRPFDHYFGTLRGVRGYGDPTALKWQSGRSVFHQPTTLHADGYQLPFRLDTTSTYAVDISAPGGWGWGDAQTLWNNGLHDKFCSARNPDLGMGYFTRPDLAFYHALADAFTIGDNYFQSCFTSTNPNRLFSVSGTNGRSVGQPSQVDNSGTGFRWKSYAERLQDAGVSWKVYQESDDFDDNLLEYFQTFIDSRPGQPLYERGVKVVPDLVAAFGADVANGTLPQVSWIVAPTALSEHADHHPPAGEDLTARLLEKLAANPAVFAKTVFILNYDEFGGFWDHIPPPVPPVNGLYGDGDDGRSTVANTGEIHTDGKPIGLGFRVPLIVVSPWTRGGYVNSEVFDHTSVLRFLERRFGVAEPNISAWRRSVCGDLTSMFDFAGTAPTTWPALPDTSRYVDYGWWQTNTFPRPTVPATQTMPTQEPGTRPARPLPYVLTVSARVTASNVYFDFTSAGTAGAHFYVTANRFRAPQVWRYTAEAGKTVSDNFAVGTPTGAYDYTCHGPNGFLRQFVGNRVTATTSGNANPEVTMRYAPTEGRIYLTMKNSGTRSCVVTVKANRYRGDGPWPYTVGAGATVEDYFTVTSSNHWYDFTATADTTDGFLRRFAGHMETGKPSTSDPTIGARTQAGPLPVVVVDTDSEETAGERGDALNVADGNPGTKWHTRWSGGSDPLPHMVVLDLGTQRSVSGLTYLPRQDGSANGRIGDYEVHVSADGVNWGSPVATGTFADTATLKTITFPVRTAKYVRLRALTEAGGRGPWTSAASVGVTGT